MSEPIERLLARKGHAAQADAISQLRSLSLDAALRLVTTVLARVLRVRRLADRIVWGSGWLLACLVVALIATDHFRVAFGLIALSPFFFFVPRLLREWPYAPWINGRAAALDLIEQADSPLRCGALLDLGAVVENVPRGWKGNALRGALDERLVRLLPRLEPEEAALLSPEQRAQLRRMLGRLRDYPESCVALLLALGTARDREAQTEARLLIVKHPSDRVRAAAQECLIDLGEPR